jgi:hypothetical protein
VIVNSAKYKYPLSPLGGDWLDGMGDIGLGIGIVDPILTSSWLGNPLGRSMDGGLNKVRPDTGSIYNCNPPKFLDGRFVMFNVGNVIMTDDDLVSTFNTSLSLSRRRRMVHILS